MFTSRAEHRLLLREDNADQRLGDLARELGLLATDQIERLSARTARLRELHELLQSHRLLPAAATNEAVAALGITPLRQPTTAAELLRRPGVGFDELRALDVPVGEQDARVLTTVLLDVKYSGYVARQEAIAERSARLETTELPASLDFAAISGLSAEVREKLGRIQPRTLGQAARIPGVTPAAIALLGVHLRRTHTA
jgi:tRNA uridine 5-carboxymethylaminomethyl modification enzyme